MFRENMSTRDRDIRLMLVAPLAVLALFFLHGIWTIIVGGIGLIFLATSALGLRPVYQLLGIGRILPARRTCRKRRCRISTKLGHSGEGAIFDASAYIWI
ncbi:MAG: DUF2892 domain-containing protein [Kouleothrix sp.]